MVNSGTGESADSGFSTRSNTGRDQDSRESLRGAHQRHQDHRQQQRREVRPDVVEKAPEFGHADCWGAAEAAGSRWRSATSDTAIEWIPFGLVEHDVLGAPGTPVVEVRRSEQHHYGPPERRGDVGGSAVVSDEKRRAGDQRFHFFERRAREAGIFAEGREVFAGTGDEQRFDPEIVIQMPRQRPGSFRAGQVLSASDANGCSTA